MGGHAPGARSTARDPRRQIHGGGGVSRAGKRRQKTGARCAARYGKITQECQAKKSPHKAGFLVLLASERAG